MLILFELHLEIPYECALLYLSLYELIFFYLPGVLPRRDVEKDRGRIVLWSMFWVKNERENAKIQKT